jgi:hypothetical protein
MGWDDRAALEWGRDWFADLQKYLTAAAAAGHAVIIWLD